MKITDLECLNKNSRALEESFWILKSFLSDESTEAFIDWEENFFWKPWDFIVVKEHLVDKIDNIKIEVRSDEHAPPHFHIMINEYEWSYKIEDCNKLEWNISKKFEKKVKLWFKLWWKHKLIEYWNSTRPTNCEVWKINS